MFPFNFLIFEFDVVFKVIKVIKERIIQHHIRPNRKFALISF